jgi:hypothetical protein
VTSHGQVINQCGEKVITSISKNGIYLAEDFYSDFELTIYRLGGTYFYSALGHKKTDCD